MTTENDTQQQQTTTQNDAQQTTTQINPPPSTELIPLDRNLLILEQKDAGESVIRETQEKEPIRLRITEQSNNQTDTKK